MYNPQQPIHPNEQHAYQQPPPGYQPYPSGQWTQPPMPPYQQYPQQAPYYPPPQMPPGNPSPYPMAPPMVQTNVNVNMQRSGPGFFVRAVYFLFVGWWAGLFWLNLGFALCALIVTLPLGLMMLNRLPQIMTLKASGTSTSVNVSTVNMQQPYGGNVMVQNINVNIGGTQQHSFLIRAVYFVFVGCWLGYLWANLAYFCFVTLLLLPVGIMMFDRLPMVLTLRRN